MDDDWGLQAVVRGCSSTAVTGASAATSASAATTTTTTATTSFMADFQQPHNSFFFSPIFGSNNSNTQHYQQQQQQQSIAPLFALPDHMTARNHVAAMEEELHELYKPFFPKSQAITPNIISVSSLSSSNDHQRVVVAQTKHNNINQSTKQSHGAPRSKKRKNQLKKVCQVPAESLSSDIWAWRKYGQKPIKGSPYPRGYYRCSSSKGCLARKQVERNRSDPGIFIVTYTAEHNHPAPTHRNSLAGSTRQKPSSAASASAAAGDSAKPTSVVKPSSPATSVEEDLATSQAHSTTTESKERPECSTVLMDDEEEEEFGLSDVAISDDFFVGLEGLGIPASGDFISDLFPSIFGQPWVASNAATAAGGS